MLPILCMTLEIKSKYKLVYELFPPLYFILKEKKKKTQHNNTKNLALELLFYCVYLVFYFFGDGIQVLDLDQKKKQL